MLTQVLSSLNADSSFLVMVRDAISIWGNDFFKLKYHLAKYHLAKLFGVMTPSTIVLNV